MRHARESRINIEAAVAARINLLLLEQVGCLVVFFKGTLWSKKSFVKTLLDFDKRLWLDHTQRGHVLLVAQGTTVPAKRTGHHHKMTHFTQNPGALCRTGRVLWRAEWNHKMSLLP